jgi:hypothetical protein
MQLPAALDSFALKPRWEAQVLRCAEGTSSAAILTRFGWGSPMRRGTCNAKKQTRRSGSFQFLGALFFERGRTGAS